MQIKIFRKIKDVENVGTLSNEFRIPKPWGKYKISDKVVHKVSVKNFSK